MSYPIGAILVKDRTAKSYQKQVEAMFNRAKEMRFDAPGPPVIVGIAHVVQDLFDRTDLALSTLDLYRAALIWFIRQAPDPTDEYYDSLARLEEIRFSEGDSATARVARVIPKDDLDELLSYLESGYRSSIWAKRSAMWLRAGLVTGLRPIEWMSAWWSLTDPYVLMVITAKVKLLIPAFQREKIPYRRPQDIGFDLSTDEIDSHGIYIQSLQDEHENPDQDRPPRQISVKGPTGSSTESSINRMIVDKHLRTILACVPAGTDTSMRDRNFTKYYDQCKNTIRLACNALWLGKKRYSLKTMRSQYSANMKAWHGPEIAATLMGHTGHNNPTRAHYGKANQAHPGHRGLRPTRSEALTFSGPKSRGPDREK